MGYIKEPEGIDLIVAPSILHEEDKACISEVIATYKRGRRRKSHAKAIKGVFTIGSAWKRFVVRPTLVEVRLNDGKFHKIVSQPIKYNECTSSSENVKRKKKRT